MTKFRVRINILVISLLLISLLTCIQGFTQIQHDSITLSIKPSYDSVNGFHRLMLGNNYRKLWAVPVTVKVIHLGKEKGGLTVEKEGGGMQTRSLRLKESSGKEWVLRSLEKYPERKLPPTLKPTIAKDILNDMISTANPFAALTVPPFAEALGIPHAVPQIVYLADDAALGEYRNEFANKVYLFEERGASDDESTSNTDKVQEKLKDDNDNKVDQKMVLRARLLDIVLGDWDRHNDQWRWAKDKDKKKTIYTPIPRDRDQVYYKTSGVLPWIVSHQYLSTKFQPYHETIRDIKGWNVNARFFDRIFLTAMNEDDWKEQIAYVQSQLSDSLIRSAIALLPPSIYALTGKDIIKIIIGRRNNLSRYALEYYRFISKTVDITMSDKKEHFDLHYSDKGQLEVSIHKIKKDGEEDKLLYQRTFIPGVTKEIRLYGFGGNDLFTVTGNSKSPVKVRMIGGNDADSILIDADVRNRSHLFIYDLKNETNKITTNSNAKLRLSKDSAVNTYDEHNFQYDRIGPLVSANYNNDDNIVVRLGFMALLHGFRKEPYSSKQEFWANYSTGRHFFRFTYEGDFKQVIGNNDLYVNVIARGPHYIRNFFGIGNETAFSEKGSQKINYFRTRHDYITAETRLRHHVNQYLSLTAGLRGQYYVASAANNINNSLENYNNSNPGKNIFNKKYYAGAIAGLVYDSRNDGSIANKGIYAHINAMAVNKLESKGNTYGQFTAEMNIYKSLNKDSSIILSNRIGAGTTAGNPDFFQLLYLGGGSNGYLRGYRSYRFAGKSFAYHNIEMRAKLFDFTSYLFPGSVGVTLFNDLGRVWIPGESSHRWHDGYGGGIYVQPAQLILIHVSAGHSSEGWQRYIELGFRF